MKGFISLPLLLLLHILISEIFEVQYLEYLLQQIVKSSKVSERALNASNSEGFLDRPNNSDNLTNGRYGKIYLDELANKKLSYLKFNQDYKVSQVNWRYLETVLKSDTSALKEGQLKINNLEISNNMLYPYSLTDINQAAFIKLNKDLNTVSFMGDLKISKLIIESSEDLKYTNIVNIIANNNIYVKEIAIQTIKNFEINFISINGKITLPSTSSCKCGDTNCIKIFSSNLRYCQKPDISIFSTRDELLGIIPNKE